jgi:two-component sensor histidine kinase
VRNVKLSVVLLLAVSLVAIGVVRGYDLYSERQRAVENAERAVDAWARILDQYVRRTFETSDLIFERVQARAHWRGGVSELHDLETHRLLVDLATRTSGDDLLIVSEHGLPVNLTAFYPASPVDLSDRPWFQAHRDRSLERYVGRPIISRLVDAVLFTYSRPLRGKGGEFEGAFQVAMRASFFDDAPLRFGSPDGEQVTFELWALDGALIGRGGMTRDIVEANIFSSEIARAVASANTGRLSDLSPVTGARQIGAYTVLPEWGVVAAASVSREAALATWRADVVGNLLIAPWAALILLALGVGALAAARTEERLTSGLARSREELAARNAELEAALRLRDLLVREVHHRVKNNLQVVASLMRLQARRSGNVESFVAATQERVHAIAMMHEIVYQRDLEAIADLGAYVEKLIQTSQTAHGASECNITIEVRCEPVELGVDEMVPVGLILAEALSNAFKHAFPDGAPGVIVLRASRAGETTIIEVRDNGVGPQDAKTGSLGLVLAATLAAQINARHELVREDGWTVFRLAFDSSATGGKRERTLA